MYKSIYAKYLLLLSDVNQTSIFLTDFRKIFKYFHENLPVGAELYHEDTQTDEQTDMTKLTVAFRKFANAPKSFTAEVCATELIRSTSKFQTYKFYAVFCWWEFTMKFEFTEKFPQNAPRYPVGYSLGN
jgi:hypothetical protein